MDQFGFRKASRVARRPGTGEARLGLLDRGRCRRSGNRLYQDGGALERLLATTVVPAAPDQTVLDVYVDGDGTITEALPIVAWAVDAAYARPITAGNDDSCSNRHRFIALPDGRFLEAVFDGMTFDSRDAAVEYATKQHADAIAAAMVAAERDRAAAA
jgi:hypothetical protein